MAYELSVISSYQYQLSVISDQCYQCYHATPKPDPCTASAMRMRHRPQKVAMNLRGRDGQRKGPRASSHEQTGAHRQQNPNPRPKPENHNHKRNPKTRTLHCKRYEDAASSGEAGDENLRGARQQEGTQGEQTSKQARTDSKTANPTPRPNPNPRNTTQALLGPRCQPRGGSNLGIQKWRRPDAGHKQSRNPNPRPKPQKHNRNATPQHCKRSEDAASSGEGGDENLRE